MFGYAGGQNYVGKPLVRTIGFKGYVLIFFIVINFKTYFLLDYVSLITELGLLQGG